MNKINVVVVCLCVRGCVRACVHTILIIIIDDKTRTTVKISAIPSRTRKTGLSQMACTEPESIWPRVDVHSGNDAVITPAQTDTHEWMGVSVRAW